MAAVMCLLRAFTGTAVKLGLLLFVLILKEDFITYVFRELPASVTILCCGGEMKHWLATGSIPHPVDTVTVQLVPKVISCCEKEGW